MPRNCESLVKLLQMYVNMKIGVVNIPIHEWLPCNLVSNHLICWFLWKIDCLATVAKEQTIQIGTTPVNVYNVVLDTCAKFHAFNTF